MTRNVLFRTLFFPGLVAALLTAGCAGEHHRVRFELEENQTAKVMITGFKTAVLVDNLGPSPVTAIFIGRSGDETVQLDQVAALRTLEEPTQVVIETGPNGPAVVVVEAREATQFIVDQMPE